MPMIGRAEERAIPAAVPGGKCKLIRNPIQAPVEIREVHDGHVPEIKRCAVGGEGFSWRDSERFSPELVGGVLDIVGRGISVRGGVDAVGAFSRFRGQPFASGKEWRKTG